MFFFKKGNSRWGTRQKKVSVMNAVSHYLDDIQHIAKRLDPKAFLNKGSWITKCPSHANRFGKNLSILRGDNGSLVVHCYSGCHWKAVMDDLRALGLISSERRQIYRPPSVFDDDPPEKPPAIESAYTDKSAQRALYKIWQETQSAESTPVEQYLKSRSLTVFPPASIRHHPGLAYWQQNTENNWTCTGTHPAMVAKIQVYPSSELKAIHRTYLHPEGLGKADVECPKKIKGKAAGGAVQFNGDSLECIAIGEGIETCLSYYQENHSLSVWAALSSSLMKTIVVPPRSVTKEFIILSDNDPQGLEAAESLATRLTYDNRVVRIITPDKTKNDFNDLLTRGVPL
jgi:putative DNA primase/helicase